MRITISIVLGECLKISTSKGCEIACADSLLLQSDLISLPMSSCYFLLKINPSRKVTKDDGLS
jgi:hypothetical protein